MGAAKGSSTMVNHPYNLGRLIESGSTFKEQLIDKAKVDIFLSALRNMVLIRTVEKKLAYAKKNGEITGPVHLGVGQEAIPAAISSYLRKTDRVFGAHRSHGHIIALGTNIRRLFSEILGRENGLCRGMGGSMHLCDQSVGFYGSVPIVAGTVPLAVGAAMAAYMSGTGDVAVAYLGDGACEEGVFHECLNLASVQKAPVIFVVENNLFASHMHISQRQPFNSTSRFGEANGIRVQVVDGNSVAEVDAAASRTIELAREGNGPALIEAITYRWYGHVDWRDDIDVGVSRSRKEVEEWKEKDPIKRLRNALIEQELLGMSTYEDICLEINNLVDDAWCMACSDPYPPESTLYDSVYGGNIQ